MTAKFLAYFTTILGVLTTLSGMFSTQIQGFVSHHPSLALVVLGIAKLISSFNKTTPVSS